MPLRIFYVTKINFLVSGNIKLKMCRKVELFNKRILYIGKANHYIVSPPDTFVLFWSSHSIILLHFIVAKQLPISRRRSAANTFMWSQIAKI